LIVRNKWIMNLVTVPKLRLELRRLAPELRWLSAAELAEGPEHGAAL
jgi:hypothetical protein